VKSTSAGSHKVKARAGASRPRFRLTFWRECRPSSAARSASVGVVRRQPRLSRAGPPRASPPRDDWRARRSVNAGAASAFSKHRQHLQHIPAQQQACRNRDGSTCWPTAEAMTDAGEIVMAVTAFRACLADAVLSLEHLRVTPWPVAAVDLHGLQTKGVRSEERPRVSKPDVSAVCNCLRRPSRDARGRRRRTGGYGSLSSPLKRPGTVP
jgi:hypothetical protein